MATLEAPRGVHSPQEPQALLRSLSQYLQADVQSLKDQVQELHRDLTKHHSLIKAEIMGDILHKSLQVDAQIAAQFASVEGLRAVFQQVAPSEGPTPLQPTYHHTHGLPQNRKGEKEDHGLCPTRPPCGRLWNLGLCGLEPE